MREGSREGGREEGKWWGKVEGRRGEGGGTITNTTNTSIITIAAALYWHKELNTCPLVGTPIRKIHPCNSSLEF